ALVVLAGSGLLLRSFQRLHAVRPGFAPDDVATLWITLPAARYPTAADVARFYARLGERLARLPGVTATGLTSRLPLEDQGRNWNPLFVEGDATYAHKLPPLQIYAHVDGGYFRA